MSSEEQKAKQREYSARFRALHPERVHEWAKRYSEATRIRAKEWQRKRRGIVLERLGNRCVRCGLDDQRVLQVDHINGGGRKEKRELRGSWDYFNGLTKLTDEELFAKYQLLCANCNWIKRLEQLEANNA